ncbi:MAG: hypothetical protein ACM3NH_03295 [Candidatus Saccharibacteria bacterium]
MKLKTSKIEPGPLLTVLFVLLIAAEVYFAYFLLFKNMTVVDEGADVKNIVRVDSKAYRSTLDYLTGLESYLPPAEAYRNPFLKFAPAVTPPAAPVSTGTPPPTNTR